MRRCCEAEESQSAPQKPPKFLLLGALTFLLPKCPLCIPGFMALLGAAGLQIGFGAGLLFALKCLGAALLLWTLVALLRMTHIRRKAKQLMKAAAVKNS